MSNAIGSAVARRLAEREQDGWQAEAPTLVQVPRPAVGETEVVSSGLHALFFLTGVKGNTELTGADASRRTMKVDLHWST